ncbi:hypothetical protein IJ425_02320 [bacterium]|nr:hypothetical protein [bacterium]
MNPSILDRIISILAYYTFGIFSIIWLIFANLTRKRISPFLSFNMYQAIFLSIVLAIISLIYSIAINLLSIVPFIGKFAIWFDLFFNRTPLYFTFTVSGLLVSLLLLYFSFFCLIGKRPRIPLVSDIVNANFGG